LKNEDEKKLLKDYNNFIENISDNLKSKIIKNISNIKSEWQNDLSIILDWLISPLREEKINLSQLNFDEALEKAKEFHTELKSTGSAIENEEGEIIMKFSDGYYWIDLETNSCEEEGESMGHCARTDADTLLSLRDSKKRPHITVAFDYNGTIRQMKGKENTKPIEKYHKYIIELLKFPNVNNDFVEYKKDFKKIKKFESEYNPEDDFHLSDLENEELLDIIKNNKDLELTFSILMKLPREIKPLEDIANHWDDLKCIENELWVEIGEDFDNLEIFNDQHISYNISQQTIINILNYNLDYNYSLSDLDIDTFYMYDWDSLLNKTKKQIIEDIINIGEELDYNEKTIKISKENVSKNYENIIIEGKEIPLVDILKQNKDSKINNILHRTYVIAQEQGDFEEAKNEILKKIKKELGEIKLIDSNWHLNVSDFIDDIINWEENYCYEKSTDYNLFLEFICYAIHESENDIIIYEPRYGWYGDIDFEYFHDTYEIYSEEEIFESDQIRKDQRLRHDFISKPDITSPGYSSSKPPKPFGVDNWENPKYSDENQPKVNNKKGKKEKKKKNKIKSYKKFFKIDQDDYKRNLSAEDGEYSAGPGKAWI